jgi:hypothetical protein
MLLAPVRLCRFPSFHRCVPFAAARLRAFALSFASVVCEMASSLGSTSATRPARSIPSSPSSFPVSSGSHRDLADGENKPHCRPSELAFPDNLAEVFGASSELEINLPPKRDWADNMCARKNEARILPHL